MSRVRSILAVALASFAPLAAPGRADEPASSASGPAFKTRLAVGGEAELRQVSAIGQQDIRLRLKISNPSDKPLEIRSGNLFLMGEGGWLTPIDPHSMDGGFLRGTSIAAGAAQLFETFEYHAFAPARHAVLVAQVDDGHGETAVPIRRAEHLDPPVAQPPYPFGVGVAGPLEVVPFADGQRSVLLIGQYQCLGGVRPEKVTTEVLLGDGSGALQPVTWNGLGDLGDRQVLWPFVRRLDVPKSFAGGLLRLRATAVLDGKPTSYEAEWPVRNAEPAEVLGPVLGGSWHLGNGPGQRDLHANYATPENRYAYDFVVVEQGVTYRGQPYRNESYFSWNKPVKAVADGTVMDTCHREPDRQPHGGADPSVFVRDAAPCMVNRVVLLHDDGLISVYLHLKQGSITKGVVQGQRVKAGQVIATVGNSGPSTEPHLQFLAYRIDPTGRPSYVPVRFRNAYEDPGGERKLPGVPVGGRTVHFLERP